LRRMERCIAKETFVAIDFEISGDASKKQST
jgi:hypothetical protein